MIKKITTILVLIFFVWVTLFPKELLAQKSYALPPVGAQIGLSTPFSPCLLKGLIIDSEDPTQFNFIVDTGDLNDEYAIQSEAERLLQYFLTVWTIPDDHFWVNLSPYEKDKVIPDFFGRTLMGRDLLAEDYLLKQLSATLTDPTTEIGQNFWDLVHKTVSDEVDVKNISLDLNNKIWIVPDKIELLEQEGMVYVSSASLKVLTQSDYLSFTKGDALIDADHRSSSHSQDEVITNILRETIIPIIEKEVNEGENFSKLRQVYYSLILGIWFKEQLQEFIYKNSRRTAGLEIDAYEEIQQIYNKYVQSFEIGVVDEVYEHYDPGTQAMKSHRYFSGGVALAGVQEGWNKTSTTGDTDSSRLSEIFINSDKDLRILSGRLKAVEEDEESALSNSPKTGPPSQSENGEYILGKLTAANFIILGSIMAPHLINTDISSNPYDLFRLGTAIFFTYFTVNFFSETMAALIMEEERKFRRGEDVDLPLYTNTYTPINPEQYPSLTIQIPVHTEDFDIIRTTIESAIAEVEHFSAINEDVNLIVSEDGLNYLADNDILGTETRARAKDESERTEQEKEVLQRLEYYRSVANRDDISFTVVARPRPDAAKPFTERKGLFKKGSNANHARKIAQEIERGVGNGMSYMEAKNQVFSQEEYSLTFTIGSPINFGEITHILDKDSIVPTGVSERALTEFVRDPNISYLQMATQPTNMDENYYSQTVGTVTKLAFRYAFRIMAMSGAMVPLVGHNVYIRTTDLDDNGGWNEDRVSEDFSFAINMITQRGVETGKYVEYSDMIFGEKVSSTIDEEMSKMMRYSYGALELMFHKPADWKSKGVLTNQWKDFLKSNNISRAVKFNLTQYLVKTVSLGGLMVSLAFSIAAPLPYQAFVIPLVVYSGFGLTTAALSGVFDSKNKAEVAKYMGRSFIFGGMTVTVSSYYALRGVFDFFFKKKPDFPPSPTVDMNEQKTLREALAGNAEKHMKTLALTGLTVGQFLLVSQGGEFTVTPGLALSSIFMLQAISYPYLLDPMFLSGLRASFSQIFNRKKKGTQSEISSSEENDSSALDDSDFAKGGVDFRRKLMDIKINKQYTEAFQSFFSTVDLDSFRGFEFDSILLKDFSPSIIPTRIIPSSGIGMSF